MDNAADDVADDVTDDVTDDMMADEIVEKITALQARIVQLEGELEFTLTVWVHHCGCIDREQLGSGAVFVSCAPLERARITLKFSP